MIFKSHRKYRTSFGKSESKFILRYSNFVLTLPLNHISTFCGQNQTGKTKTQYIFAKALENEYFCSEKNVRHISYFIRKAHQKLLQPHRIQRII